MKRIRCHKKSSHKEAMSLKDILLLATAALGFVKMVYDTIKDILN